MNLSRNLLEWSPLVGGSFSDQLTTVALDSTGDILVAGYMNLTDFPFLANPNFTPEQNRVWWRAGQRRFRQPRQLVERALG